MNLLKLLKTFLRRRTPISDACMEKSIASLETLLNKTSGMWFDSRLSELVEEVADDVYFSLGQELSLEECHEASLWIENSLRDRNFPRRQALAFLDTLKVLQAGLKKREIPKFNPVEQKSDSI